ncbi:MAG: hypothetical protein QM766_05870 [Burkholderiaceae bacterium]
MLAAHAGFRLAGRAFPEPLALTGSTARQLFGLLVFGPVVETTAFALAVVALVRTFGISGTRAVIAAAVLSGAVHGWGAGSAVIAVPAAWGFYWFGRLFLERRSKGFGRGLGAAAWLHALCNLPAALLVLLP